jgi:hypothetical protein
VRIGELARRGGDDEDHPVLRAGGSPGPTTLAEIRDVITARDTDGPPCEHVRRLLDAHAAGLDARILELDRLRGEVEDLRRRAVTLDPAACTDAAVCHVVPT